MFDLLLKKTELHVYSILPFFGFLIGIIITIIFLFYYFFSKNKIFLCLAFLALAASFYNFCLIHLFVVKDMDQIIIYFKLYFLSTIFLILAFIFSVYKVIERPLDKYILITGALVAILIIINFTLFPKNSIMKIKDQYRFSLNLFYNLFLFLEYSVLIYGLYLLRRNTENIRNNISIPIFVKSAFYGIFFIFLLVVTDVLVISGVINIPPLLPAGFIIYLLFLLFEVSKNQVIYYDILKNNYLQTIMGLTDLLDSRDQYTSKHAYRVSRYATFLAGKLDLDKNRIQYLKIACLLHDIGKINVPDKILLKKGKLTKEEWRLIKKHSEEGESILELVNFLQEEAKLVRTHHERSDGKGYPDEVNEDELPVESQLLSISDAFDAMTSDRPYRKKFSLIKVLKKLNRAKGSQFSKRMVDLFIENWTNIVDIYKDFKKTDNM